MEHFKLSFCLSSCHHHSLNLLSGIPRCSRFILYFPAPTLEPGISPRNPWECYFEAMLCMLGMLIASGIFLLPGTLNGQNICVCTYKQYTHIFSINIFILYIGNHEFISVSVQHFSFHSSFIPFHLCTSILY